MISAQTVAWLKREKLRHEQPRRADYAQTRFPLVIAGHIPRGRPATRKGAHVALCGRLVRGPRAKQYKRGVGCEECLRVLNTPMEVLF